MNNLNLNFNSIFNSNTLNIFTDASIMTMTDGMIVSAPGAVCVITYKGDTYILEEDFEDRNLIIGSTNNEGEIHAVAMGVYFALKYRDKFKYINLFSDSNTCIQGLTKWIYKWASSNKNGILVNSSNQPVSNQNIFISIVNTIIENNLEINFYHQKGHVKNNMKGMNKCFNDFIVTNDLYRNVDISILEAISVYNDYVDVKTKEQLKTFSNIYYTNDKIKPTIRPIEFGLRFDQMQKYKQLIKRRFK